jgi:hypothetical protein
VRIAGAGNVMSRGAALPVRHRVLDVVCGIVAGAIAVACSAALLLAYDAVVSRSAPAGEAVRHTVAAGSLAALCCAACVALLSTAFAAERRCRADWRVVLVIATVIVVIASAAILPALAAINSCELGVAFPIDNHACR